MNQRVRGRDDAFAVEHTVPMRKPGYATQMSTSPFRRKATLRRLLFPSGRPADNYESPLASLVALT
jgi:hypothetical protein